MPTILWSRSSRRCATCMPMKPAAPVTRIFISLKGNDAAVEGRYCSLNRDRASVHIPLRKRISLADAAVGRIEVARARRVLHERCGLATMPHAQDPAGQDFLVGRRGAQLSGGDGSASAFSASRDRLGGGGEPL